MKPRPNGFLAEDKISHDSEIFDYIRELHDYLWQFVRVFYPGASGVLDDYIDNSLAMAKTAEKFSEKVWEIFALKNNVPTSAKDSGKIAAIMDGGDWYDASVEHLVIPIDMNLKQQKEEYDNWYYDRNRPPQNYDSFTDWLKKRGARETTEDEVLEFWGGP
jgi:hypothetical protein